MPSRRDFLTLVALVFGSAGRPAASDGRQAREEKLTTVTLVIDGMT